MDQVVLDQDELAFVAVVLALLVVLDRVLRALVGRGLELSVKVERVGWVVLALALAVVGISFVVEWLEVGIELDCNLPGQELYALALPQGTLVVVSFVGVALVVLVDSVALAQVEVAVWVVLVLFLGVTCAFGALWLLLA